MIIFCLPHNLVAQNKIDIPQEIIAKFNQHYPNASILDAAFVPKSRCYLISTVFESKIIELEYDTNGDLIREKKEIDIRDLSTKIIKMIHGIFPESEIVQAFRIKGKLKEIEVVIFEAENEYRLFFNEKGLLKRKVHVEEGADFGC